MCAEVVVVVLDAEFGDGVEEGQVSGADAAVDDGKAWVDLLEGLVSGLEEVDELFGGGILPEDGAAWEMRFVPEFPEENVRVALGGGAEVVAPGLEVQGGEEAEAFVPECVLWLGGVPAWCSECVDEDAVVGVAGDGGVMEEGVDGSPVVGSLLCLDG